MAVEGHLGKVTSASERLKDPFRGRPGAPDTTEPSAPFVEIRDLVLRGETVTDDVAKAVVGGEIERTMDGASTLTLTLHDPDLFLLNSDLFDHAVDLKLDRFWFRLARVVKTGPEVELTFEDREVAWLRDYTKPRRAYRDTVTRAEFVQMLLKEVSEGEIDMYCPELHVAQPIEGSGAPNQVRGRRPISTRREQPTKTSRVSDREGGLNRTAGLTVKGIRASPEQLAIAERALNVAASLGAPDRTKVALIMALIQESQIANLTGGHDSSVGVLQLLNIHLGGSTSTKGGRRDVELVVKMFLQNGFTGSGGAIALAKSQTNPANIAGLVQGNANGASDYAPWQSEASKWVAAFTGNPDLAGDGSQAASQGTRTIQKRYGFTRGIVGRKESSWEAIQRLGEEVAWRAFMVEGRLFFVSEEDLFRARPRLRLSEQSEGVDWIDFEVDRNLKVSEATITCRADMWDADPGTVVELFDMGKRANGRWLVHSMRRGVLDRAAEIRLKKPNKEKLEPAPETRTETVPLGSPQSIAARDGDRRSSGKTTSPFGGKFPISGAYGTDRGDHTHAGLDVGTPCGTPCIAPFDGTVTYATTSGFGTAGGMLHLQSAGGEPGLLRAGDKVGWGHVSGVSARVGQKVKAGQRIGTSGGSPCHVHFVYLRAGGGGNGVDGNADPTALLRKLGGV